MVMVAVGAIEAVCDNVMGPVFRAQNHTRHALVSLLSVPLENVSAIGKSIMNFHTTLGTLLAHILTLPFDNVCSLNNLT